MFGRSIRGIKLNTSFRSTFASTTFRSFSVTRSNNFFNKTDPNELINKIKQALESNPRIGSLINEFKDKLLSKGISQQPSFLEMMKIAQDQELKDCLKELSSEFEKADIKINPADLQEIAKVFNK